MDERIADDSLALQREIEEKRNDLALSLEQLRGNLRRKIEYGRKLRDGVLLATLLGGAVVSLLWFGMRVRRRR